MVANGGTCSRDNIRLCCSGCNQNMGDDMTVLEYKANCAYLKLHDTENIEYDCILELQQEPCNDIE